MVTNTGILSTMATTPTAQIDDGNDAIHSGILMALNAASGENRAVDGFDIEQGVTSSHTHYVVTSTGSASHVLRNGKFETVADATLTTDATSNGGTVVGTSNPNKDWYGLIVVNSSNVLKWRHGTSSPTSTGKLDPDTATVAALTAGDIPIAVVKYIAGSDDDAVRPIQFLSYLQATREFSALNAGVETFRIKKEGSVFTNAGGTVTFPTSNGVLALQNENTSGTAAGLSATLAIASGGTGATANTTWLNSKITTTATGALTYNGTTAVAVNHDSLAGFVTAEHIDWTASSAGTIDASNYTNTQLDNAGVIGKVLTGLDVTTGSVADVAAADTIIAAFGKIERRVRLNDDKVTNTDVDVSKINLLARLDDFDSTDTVNIGDGGNDTTVNIKGNLNVLGTTTTLNATEIDVLDAMVFTYDSGSDGFDTTLRITEPTADRIITLPDITGIVALTNGSIASAEKVETTASNANANYNLGLFATPTASGDANTILYDGLNNILYNPSSNILTVGGAVNSGTSVSGASHLLVGRSIASAATLLGELGGGFNANELYNSGGSYYSSNTRPLIEAKSTLYAEARLVVDAAAESSSDTDEYYGTGAVYAIEAQQNQHRSGIVLTHDDDITTDGTADYTWGIGKQFSTAGVGTPHFQIGFKDEKTYKEGFLTNDADFVFRSDNSYFSISNTGVVTIPNQLKASKYITFATNSDAANTADAGTLRYTGTKMQFKQGTAWVDLAAGSSGEANQNAWGIITVPAGTTPQTAAEDADSIAFLAGTGMTITGGTDTITFSSADTNTNIGNAASIITSLTELSTIDIAADHLVYRDNSDSGATKKLTLLIR